MAIGNDNSSSASTPPAIRLPNRSSLGVFLQVVNAIIMREVRARFGQGNLGYLRGLLEPVVFMGGFLLLWIGLGRASPIAVPIELFFLCSLFPCTAFLRTWEYSSSAIKANVGLLMFPVARPLDFFIARIILEATSQIFIFIILATIVHGIFGEVRHLPDDPLNVLLAAVSAILLAAGMGLTTGCLMMEFSTVEVFMQPLRRVFFFTSGVFFVADSLPNIVKDYLWWNPLLHATELFRISYFSEASSNFLNKEYLWGSVVFLLVLGLILERRLQRKGY
jgi:capsular polysaccharide transport system permease protein